MVTMPAASPAFTSRNGSAPLSRLSTIFQALDLIDDPFPLDPRAGAFAPTSVHGPARAQLLTWAAGESSGPDGRLGIVVGEQGSGKTRLLIELAEALAAEPAHAIALLPDDEAYRTDAQILRGILAAFGQVPVGRTGLELMAEFREALAAIEASGKRPGLLIDGADFSGSRLELTRNLLRDAGGNGLWILLLGQPDLRDRIARRRSLRGLLELTVELGPLDTGDCRTLVDHRVDAMRRAGDHRPRFDDDAHAILAGWSHGNAGKVVHLAGECLVEAIARGAEIVDERIAHQVARELTDQARAQARAEAASPLAEPAIQTKIPLFLDDHLEVSSPATSSGRSGRGRRR